MLNDQEYKVMNHIIMIQYNTKCNMAYAGLKHVKVYITTKKQQNYEQISYWLSEIFNLYSRFYYFFVVLTFSYLHLISIINTYNSVHLKKAEIHIYHKLLGKESWGQLLLDHFDVC